MRIIRILPIRCSTQLFLVAAGACFTQKLTHFNAASWKDTRKHACLERLALDARQSSQQRRRRNQIAAIPFAVGTALFNYIEFIADFEGEVGCRRWLERIDADSKGDPRKRPPRHLRCVFRYGSLASITGPFERSSCILRRETRGVVCLRIGSP